MTGATLQKTTKSETAAIGRASQRTEEEPSPRRWLILGVLAAVAFMAQLDLFVVNIALPAMAGSFGHAKLSGLSWVLNGYSITFAALLVPMGRLADHFGRKRFLLAGVGVFTLGSVIDAVAPSLVVMVIGRVIQAVGGAMIIPTSLGLLYPSFPKHEHAKVVGIWAGVAAIAASSGPTIGGLLVHVDWRWIFVINVPIGAATVIAGVKILPEVRAHKSARLPDAFSGLVLVATLALVTFATVQSSTWGWGDPRTIAAFAIAVITGAATVWRTITHPHALIEASLFESRQFTTATAALFLFFVAFAGWLLMNVLLFQEQWALGSHQDRPVDHPGTAVLSGVRDQRGKDHRQVRQDASRHRRPAAVRSCKRILADRSSRRSELLDRLVPRPDRGRVGRRHDAGPAVCSGQHASPRACWNRKRNPEHVAAGRKRDRCRGRGDATGLRAWIGRLPARARVHDRRPRPRIRDLNPRRAA